MGNEPDSVSEIGDPPGTVRAHATGPCFLGAFAQMSVAIDDLQVRCTPKAEERRPWCGAMLAPHLEQRHAMIDFRGPP